MSDIDLSTWLTKAQAAEQLGVSTKAIERWVQAGKLPQSGSEDGERLSLAHGDLLVMPAGFQDEWEHCVPVEDATGERCSIVFRAA